MISCAFDALAHLVDADHHRCTWHHRHQHHGTFVRALPGVAKKLVRSFGVSEDIMRTLLSGIPKTDIIDAADAERLWSQWRKLFFKPAAGFGSRAANRGDKLTTRVWEQM